MISSLSAFTISIQAGGFVVEGSCRELQIAIEWKLSSPVWSHNGAVCSASAFKKHVGLNFFQGAFIEDPQGLFNSGLESKKSRSINYTEGDLIDETALKELVRKAVDYNTGKS